MTYSATNMMFVCLFFFIKGCAGPGGVPKKVTPQSLNVSSVSALH